MHVEAAPVDDASQPSLRDRAAAFWRKFGGT